MEEIPAAAVHDNAGADGEAARDEFALTAVEPEKPTAEKSAAEPALRLEPPDAGPGSQASVGTTFIHPTDKDPSAGTPFIHPTDKDPSMGTPFMRQWAAAKRQNPDALL